MSSSSQQPCDNYQLDKAAPLHATCKCGHRQIAHRDYQRQKEAPVTSKPPATPDDDWDSGASNAEFVPDKFNQFNAKGKDKQ